MVDKVPGYGVEALFRGDDMVFPCEFLFQKRLPVSLDDFILQGFGDLLIYVFRGKIKFLAPALVVEGDGGAIFDGPFKITEVVEKFIKCGDYREGLARITDIKECLPDEKKRTSARARLIKKVYGVAPLVCPCCGFKMKILVIVFDPGEIKKILTYLSKIGRSPPAFDPASLN